MGLTDEEYGALLNRRKPSMSPPKSKYRNQKVVINGEKFSSKKEAAFYQELKLREQAGDVRNIERQVSFALCCPELDMDFRLATIPRVNYVSSYVADFTFEEYAGNGSTHVNWVTVVADVKGGKNTPMFALKRKWLELQSGISIREVR